MASRGSSFTLFASTAPPKTAPFAASLHAHLEFVRAERARLLNYYHGDESILRKAAILSPEDADTPLSARLALLALGRKRRLVIGAMGSSVTAGHDSFHDAAWPAVLERWLAPTFKQLGATLVVRNQAVGGATPFPASLCVRSMLGSDVDILLREWEYWRYSDGLPASSLFAKPGANSEHAAMELFLRAALALPSQPAVHFLSLNTEGAASPRDATMLKTWIWGGRPKAGGGSSGGGSGGNSGSSSSNSGGRSGGALSKLLGRREELGVLADYRGFSLQGFDAFGGPFDHLRHATPPSERWLRSKRNQSICSSEQLRHVGNCPVVYERQDGHHTTAAWVTGQKLPRQWLERPELSWQLNSLFINWHLAPLGHEVIGSQLADYYLGLLESVLSELHASAKAVDGSMPTAAALEAATSSQPLPANVACSDLLCQYSAPRCAYSTLPKAEGPDVGDWMLNSSASTAWRLGYVEDPSRLRRPGDVFYDRTDCKAYAAACLNDDGSWNGSPVRALNRGLALPPP